MEIILRSLVINFIFFFSFSVLHAMEKDLSDDEIWVADIEKGIVPEEELSFFSTYFSNQQYMKGYWNNKQVIESYFDANKPNSEGLKVLFELHKDIPHIGWHIPFTFPQPLDSDKIARTLKKYIDNTQEVLNSSIPEDKKNEYKIERLNFLTHLQERLNRFSFDKKMRRRPLYALGGISSGMTSMFCAGYVTRTIPCDDMVPWIAYGVEIGSLMGGFILWFAYLQITKQLTRESQYEWNVVQKNLNNTFEMIQKMNVQDH